MEIDNKLYFSIVEEEIAAGRDTLLTLRGTSMTPTLHEGDKLTLEPLHREPEVGDVVLFRHGGSHLLHRIVAAEGDNLTMQGDNCYSTESAQRADVVARLKNATLKDGTTIDTGSEAWRRRSRRSLLRKQLRNSAIRWLGHRGRRQLRPWYFVALAFLMWAPLNGVGIPLDNYILGLRADHLLHASVYLPIALFLMDLAPRRRWWLLWLAACAIGLATEWGQYVLPFRKFDINDMVANLIGVSMSWLAIIICRMSKKSSTFAN